MAKAKRKPSDEPPGYQAKLDARLDGWRAGMVEGLQAAVRALGGTSEAARVVQAELERRFPDAAVVVAVQGRSFGKTYASARALGVELEDEDEVDEPCDDDSEDVDL